MTRVVTVGKVKVGAGHPILIAGPCVIEGRQKCLAIAARLADLAHSHRIPLIFKASYDKANRSSLSSYRGPGLARGLDILAEIKSRHNLPILTDIHNISEIKPAARVVDIIQIPAFLCRQTDLVVAAGESGIPVNVKKAQFMSPHDIPNVIAKIESTGNHNIILTERGSSFGYNNLVADMRSLIIMAQYGFPVIFDATHSVQKPGGAGERSTGDGKWAPHLARAAIATGCDGVFMETHLNPAQALSDKDNMIPFKTLGRLWKVLVKIDRAVRES